MTTVSGHSNQPRRHHFKAGTWPNWNFWSNGQNRVLFRGQFNNIWPYFTNLSNYRGFTPLASLASLILHWSPIISIFGHILPYLYIPDVSILARLARCWARRAGMSASRVKYQKFSKIYVKYCLFPSHISENTVNRMMRAILQHSLASCTPFGTCKINVISLSKRLK